jgi:hypothetical protein
MKVSLTDALYSLRPNLKWCIEGDSYEGIKWYEEFINKPTEEELLFELHRLQNNEPLRVLREERDKRLTACDWYVSRAFCKNELVPGEILKYMQALRDLPSTSTPTLNEAGQLDMSSVDWPVKPLA